MTNKFVAISTYFSDDSTKEATVYGSAEDSLYRVVGVHLNKQSTMVDFNTINRAQVCAEDFVSL